MNWNEALAACARECDSFYLYSEGGLRRRGEALKKAFPGAEILYSIKCNPHPRILKIMAELGLGFDAAGAGEVERVLNEGADPSHIYYSAPGKSREDIAAAIGRCVITADSMNEVSLLREAAEGMDIGLRVNPSFSFDGGPGLPSKFGIDEEEALGAIRRGAFGGVRIAGLHVHLKSQELDAGKIAAYWSRVLGMAGRFRDALGKLDFVNLGSCIGLSGTGEAPLDLKDLSGAFEKAAEKFHGISPETRILLESGRWIAGPNGVYASRVADRKVSRGKIYIILKSTLGGFMRPCLVPFALRCSGGAEPAGQEPLFTSSRAFPLYTLKNGPAEEKVTIAGSLCTASDTIAEDVPMPRLERGDLVIIGCAGVYGATLSPSGFSSLPKAGEFFLTSGGELRR